MLRRVGNTYVVAPKDAYNGEAAEQIALLEEKIANDQLIKRQVEGEVIVDIAAAKSAIKRSKPVTDKLETIRREQGTAQQLRELAEIMSRGAEANQQSLVDAMAAVLDKLDQLKIAPQENAVVETVALLNTLVKRLAEWNVLVEQKTISPDAANRQLQRLYAEIYRAGLSIDGLIAMGRFPDDHKSKADDLKLAVVDAMNKIDLAIKDANAVNLTEAEFKERTADIESKRAALLGEAKRVVEQILAKHGDHLADADKVLLQKKVTEGDFGAIDDFDEKTSENAQDLVAEVLLRFSEAADAVEDLAGKVQSFPAGKSSWKSVLGSVTSKITAAAKLPGLKERGEGKAKKKTNTNKNIMAAAKTRQQRGKGDNGGLSVRDFVLRNLGNV